MIQGTKIFYEFLHESGIEKLFKKIQPITYDDYIYAYCHKLDIYNEVLIKKIIVCAFTATKLGLIDNNTPSSIAVGCIYFVLQELGIDINKSEIELCCGPSLVTISKTYKELLPFRKLFKKILDKYKVEVKSKEIDCRE